MLDFLKPQVRTTKYGIEIIPDFITYGVKDVMVKASRFYAIWDYENNTWSTSEDRASELIDKCLDKEKEKYTNIYQNITIRYLKYMNNGSAKAWNNFLRNTLPDNYKQLNNKIIFKSDEIKRSDYCNIRADYDLEEGEPECYNKLFNIIFEPKELEKLEWAIGSILTGASKKIQKFIVLYGEPGTGKSTYIEKVIQKLFDGYYTMFNAKELADNGHQFSMTPFKDNPLVAIQADGDLSRIMDNTKLNSIVSHEEMIINEKQKPQYSMKINTFLFMATNYPVDISSAKSGLNRRLIVVQPTGKKVGSDIYEDLVDGLEFEKGKIANKCVETFKRLGKNYYNNYIPEEMKLDTDAFYNFIEEDYYENIREEDAVRANEAYRRYKKYCEDNNIKYVYSYIKFRSELKPYFREFYKVKNFNNGAFARNYYQGFKKSMLGLESDIVDIEEVNNGNEGKHTWINLNCTKSILDDILSDWPAQYADESEKPIGTWTSCNTYLRDLDTSRLHYIRVPSNHIVIDFDLKDDNGNKSLDRNIEAASKFPKTYCEVSKGGAGLHLHYIYDGDVSELANLYSLGIEIKVFNGKSSLRRRVSLCNDIPVAHISTGLPKKEEKKLIDFKGYSNEKQLRKFIKDCLEKKHHGATKPEVDFIFSTLEDMYNRGISYDVRDMRQAVYIFCLGSHNQKDKCRAIFDSMKFCSKDFEEEEVLDLKTNDTVELDAPIIFLDVEVVPNLLLICWKFLGKEYECVRMFNPSAEEVEELFKYRIVGHNVRRYDNHICYGRSMGYSNRAVYNLSKRIIDGDRNAFLGEAYNLSYCDTYDVASNDNRMSLKKWEIKLGLPHKEMDIDWNEDLPEDRWDELADYCCNDVMATEAVWTSDYLKGDILAREILSDISGLSMNDTTNSHTIRIITNGDPNPNKDYIYTDLATGKRSDGTVDSIKFPGYIFNEKEPNTKKKSTYMGEYVSEGGWVFAEPGMYGYTPVFDIASMHPSSIEALNLFGPYTKNFSMLKLARIYIKHEDYEAAGKLFDGKLKPYLRYKENAKALSYALKIAINSVYGLTSATFPNKLRDERNIDNIVAKRGALFMITLKHAVCDKGYRVAHVKTDSIKVPGADNIISDFIFEFGKKYGYTFEIEDVYDRICLVNNAVYIAKYQTPKIDKETGKEIWWTATGAEFAHPYIFKTLFSHEDVEFSDLCEVKAVTSDMYLDLGNGDNYIFIGKVGSFIPMKRGGGRLLRKAEDKSGNVKYDAVTGTKDYLWLESSYVKENHLEGDIDYSYYENLADAAKNHISQFGNFEAFVNGEPVPSFRESTSNEEEVPF